MVPTAAKVWRDCVAFDREDLAHTGWLPGTSFPPQILMTVHTSALPESHAAHAWVLHLGTRAAAFCSPDDGVIWRFVWYSMPYLALFHPSKQGQEF